MSPDPPALTAGHGRVVMLQTGFGQGRRFLAAWQAWRDLRSAGNDLQRSDRFVFIVIEPQPPSHAELTAAHRASPWPQLAEVLLAAWPPLTPNLHRLSFEGGRVQLLLLVAEVQPGAAELVARVDRFWIDGALPGPAPGPTQEPVLRLCKTLGRLAAPDAMLSASNAGPAWRTGLTSAGFSVHAPLPGDGPQPTLHARFAPSFTPRRAPVHNAAPRSPNRCALIIGGGLAGCAAAWALAEQGWHSRVLERRAQIASEGSGNPAGLFHGIVNAQDGLHARFNRAAALEAQRAVRLAIGRHGAQGSVSGLLRLESTLDLRAMRVTLAQLGLPPDYVLALDAAAASARAGIALVQPAWHYPGGGWVDPGGLARSFLERAAEHSAQHAADPVADLGADRAADRTALCTGIEVHTLQRTASGWRLLDIRGAFIDEAEVVVLANAGDAMRLLADVGPARALRMPLVPTAPLVPLVPMLRTRGQISMLAAAALPLPTKLPITGAGYLLPELQGQVIFGATSQAGDADASVRAADHALNLVQLQRLTGWTLDIDPQSLAGRTAWRWATADRLPVIGAVPDLQRVAAEPADRAPRLDQPRFVPRLPGLFMFTGLGSRGITWCALGAQVLASLIAGAPAPVEASLLDAIDPARFTVRRARRRAGGR